MITVRTANYITDRDIFKHFGTHYEDYSCFSECANDSYVTLDLSEDAITELNEEIEWYEDKCEDQYVNAMKHELELVKYLRSLGYDDYILISVSW